jgi:arylsulfatase A-like enzyme
MAGTIAALSVALLGSCAPDERGSEPQSVLLVTLDTTRADVLSGDAASRALAPRIAALAESGVRFPRAYTVAPLTLPAHASLLTGLVPPRHGVRDNGLAALPDSASTLAELLAAQGFDTAAFVSSLVLDRGFGLDQGFARYDQPELVPRVAGEHALERPASESAHQAAVWLERHDRTRPFFLWVHFYDAHLPYRSAPEHLARAHGDAYRGEVAALDDAVGVLLDALDENGLDSRTVVVLTADHGESLGEHGEPTHGALCYEAAVRVPLLFRFPGEPPQPGPARFASLVDVLPTLLGRLALPVPAGLDGIDLFAASAPAERGIYFESYSGYLNYGWSPLAGWVDGRGKYLHSSEPEFYATLLDPAERYDLASSHGYERELARERIAELLALPALTPDEGAPDAELAAALAAIGYGHGCTATVPLPSPLLASDRPSPKAGAHELEPLLRAHALFEQGRFAECREIVAEIVHENPRHLLALDLYSLCLMQAREFEQAEAVLRKRLSAAEAADARLNLGLCRLELADLEGAWREIELARRQAPHEPAILAALERVRRRLGS